MHCHEIRVWQHFNKPNLTLCSVPPSHSGLAVLQRYSQKSIDRPSETHRHVSPSRWFRQGPACAPSATPSAIVHTIVLSYPARARCAKAARILGATTEKVLYSQIRKKRPNLYIGWPYFPTQTVLTQAFQKLVAKSSHLHQGWWENLDRV